MQYLTWDIMNWISGIIAFGVCVVLVIFIGSIPFVSVLFVPAYEWVKAKFTDEEVEEKVLFVGGTTEFNPNSETLDNAEKGWQFRNSLRENRPQPGDPEFLAWLRRNSCI
ncbi:MAG: hypothetical protein WC471_03700 [Candidatus Woesearchaeota archaeon]